MACDTTSSAFAGRLYVSWTDAHELGVNLPIRLRYSTDQGQSWSATVPVSESPITAASNIAIGPDGTVHVAWQEAERIGFDQSFDGGVTFGVDRYPATIVPNEEGSEVLEFPFLGVDRTGGPHHGNLYIAWCDHRNGDPDISFVRSTDNGQTWSAPIRVNDDRLGNGATQFQPMLSVDPKGRIVIAFYDRRRHVGQALYEIWGAISRDGGLSFDTNFLITDLPSRTGFGFIGHYSSGVATNDRLHPFWADTRNSEVDVYTEPYPNVFDYDEVDGIRWASRTSMIFTAQDARFGLDLSYDVASGFLTELIADGSYARVSCLARPGQTRRSLTREHHRWERPIIICCASTALTAWGPTATARRPHDPPCATSWIQARPARDAGGRAGR